MNEPLATQIQQEIGRVEVQIGMLQRYKESLEGTLNLMKHLKIPAGAIIPPRPFSNKPVAVRGGDSEPLADLKETELYQPQPVPGLVSTPIPSSQNQPNTLEMTRVVLKNAGGEEKTVDELREMIRRTYGIEPAKSLDQMLYKRSAGGRGFYKTADGRYGLSELRKGVAIEEVPMISTTVV